MLSVEPLPTQVELTLHHSGNHAPHVRLEVVGRGAEALERLAAPQAYDAMLTDLGMLDLTGLDFVREARRSAAACVCRRSS